MLLHLSLDYMPPPKPQPKPANKDTFFSIKVFHDMYHLASTQM
jgi:hypothetical protein